MFLIKFATGDAQLSHLGVKKFDFDPLATTGEAPSVNNGLGHRIGAKRRQTKSERRKYLSVACAKTQLNGPRCGEEALL